MTFRVNLVLMVVVMMHELIHGLGFVSQLENPSGLPNFLCPQIQNQYGMTSLSPMSVYDSIIEGFAPLIATFTSFRPLPVYPKIYEIALASTPHIANAGNALFRLATSLNLNITMDDGYIYYLQSPSKYTKRRSIDHSRGGSKLGPDFIMNPSLGSGSTIDSILKSNGWTLPLGPGIIGALEKMGYATRRKPQLLELELSI